ncbi:MAG: carbamoyl-phosphate synthase (glutamine-hydrolyzing) large subunit [Candidatus Marinimicrobia bacterium]|nr:carbamoyl-phosphate synthase (glutamine-hydrolyzing) large subunit [Candidatus Neomarinimicrobiota bacterium]
MKDKIKKVLILGSSALKIGEAGEFDYSGSQAIKALKEEKIETVLINPNIATIQTSDYLADKVYLLPVTTEFVENVIKKEKPDGILLGFGGQTALNCGMDLVKKGILKKYKIEILGTNIKAIEETEDRQKFNEVLAEIDVKYPKSQAVNSTADAIKYAEKIEYPVMVRIAYALGGLGSGMCSNKAELKKLSDKAFSYTSQILIEEYLKGWKEIEYEVVRDKYDNCITVCNMENFDPLGIHTGESIVVAPSQTLSNEEYHKLREIAIRTIKHLGIVGECNIQYALDPNSWDYRVIEVNARLSRSSALASKATGYPLAHIAAKLAIGYGLHELKNTITKTSAFFEPALDYVVVKIPRWDLKKFRKVSRKIGSSMKSVGEVMAIGRKFEEALQKALRMLDIGAKGVIANSQFEFENLSKALKSPDDERVFAVAKAMESGYSVDKIHKLTHIDKWFLYKIKNIVNIALKIGKNKTKSISISNLRECKQFGFSDEQISILTGISEKNIYKKRIENKIIPAIKRIDTVGAEYPAYTNYLYLTYNGISDDLQIKLPKSVILLGSGSYKIGSSVEFDWCCVVSGNTLKNEKYSTVMINCNPETVSTDYDEFDVLFFEELTFETVREIYNKINPLGIIVSMGGQIPNNLALKLSKNNMQILGTSPYSIDRAENRSTFSAMLDMLEIGQPLWEKLESVESALKFAKKVDYPVLVRPSYVLSGAAMAVASNRNELEKFLKKAVNISNDYPVVISKFLSNAKELEFDAVAQNGEIISYAISEHVENAGVHSGDATLVIPPQRTYFETMRQIRNNSEKIAKELNIDGPFNIQYIAKNNDVKVIECNLRASRSFPFISKTLKYNFIDIATKVIVGKRVSKTKIPLFDYEYVGVKAPQFSFTRLDGADPATGVEMYSTGEVACLGDNFNEAFLKSMISVGLKLPIKSIFISSGPIESKAELLESMRIFKQLGIKLYGTKGTADFLNKNNVKTKILHWPLEKTSPNVMEYIQAKKIDLVINIPKNFNKEELTNGYTIRRGAVEFAISLITNRQIAMRLAESLFRYNETEIKIKSMDEYRI